MSPILYILEMSGFERILTQRAVVASRRATNLATDLPKYFLTESVVNLLEHLVKVHKMVDLLLILNYFCVFREKLLGPSVQSAVTQLLGKTKSLLTLTMVVLTPEHIG